MQKLSQMRPSQRGRIVGMTDHSAVASRLWALGIMPGVDIRVVGVAPLGDPMLVQMDCGRISLRREEADKLNVEPAS